MTSSSALLICIKSKNANNIFIGPNTNLSSVNKKGARRLDMTKSGFETPSWSTGKTYQI